VIERTTQGRRSRAPARVTFQPKVEAQPLFRSKSAHSTRATLQPCANHMTPTTKHWDKILKGSNPPPRPSGGRAEA